MTRTSRIAICLAGGLTLSVGLRADDVVLPANPYTQIIARNIFDLNPPPPPVDPNLKSADPLPKIIPNGTMTIFGVRQVLFHALFKGRPGKPDANQSYILAEGQRQDDIEVVKIDDKAGLITFDNHGDTEELPLADVPSSTTAGAEANSSGPNNGNSFGGQRGGFNSGNGGTYAGRNFGGPRSGFNSGNNYNNGFNNGVNMQSAQMRGTDPRQQPAISTEAQMIMIEAQRMKYQQDGDPTARIMPTTPLTSEATGSDDGNTPPDNPPAP